MKHPITAYQCDRCGSVHQVPKDGAAKGWARVDAGVLDSVGILDICPQCVLGFREWWAQWAADWQAQSDRHPAHEVAAN